MRSKTLLFVALFSLLYLPTQSQAGMFFDNFNDGNANGWMFPFNDDLMQGPGVWSVENGTLVQRYTGDNISGLVDNLVLSSQVIESEVRATIGYAGVVLWYQQVNDLTANFVSVSHNFQRGLWVLEVRNGQGYLTEPLDSPWIGSDTWYDLRVEADSVTGELVISLVHPGGVYSYTYLSGTSYRSGLSGVYCGNEAAYFDNFRLTSDDIAPVPEPATMLLLASGLVGLAGLRRRFKNKEE